MLQLLVVVACHSRFNENCFLECKFVRARIKNVFEYINDENPDILLLQEIKTQEETFPFEEFKKFGYISYVFGQKSYNGVSIISKSKLENINKTFITDDLKQSRIITGEIKFKKKLR